MKAGIYLIENNINHKKYIGASKGVKRRISDHRYKYKDNKYNKQWYNHKLYIDMREFGLSNFTFTILQYCDESQLKDLEVFYYNKYLPEYNTFVPTKDPRNIGRLHHSEETKKKISEHNARYWKGKNLPPEMIDSIIKGSINKRKPVQAFKGDKLILEFDKISDALIYFNRDKNATTMISSVCNTNKEVFGYLWKFK